MKFGLMFEIQVPEPHYEGIEQEKYKQVLAQAELGDEVGFDYFWTVEHHFLNSFSHCSAPEVLYGAVSQRTKRIRIGHAVVLLPHRYNHPIRVAERAAVLDILSDGRMDLGTGRSTTLIEVGGFEVDPETTQPEWREAVSIIPRMWTEDPFSYEGEFFNIPPRSIIPKPVQKPHPPMWHACSQPTSFKLTGEMGLGVLCFNFAGHAALIERVQMYKEGLKNVNPVGSFVNDQIAALCMVHCGEDDAEAKEIGCREGMWFVNKANELYNPWKKQGVSVPDSYKFAVSAVEDGRMEMTAEDHMKSGAFAMGDPDSVIEVIRGYEAAGVDQVLCMMNIGNMPHSKVMDSINHFAKHVIPAFR